VPLERVVVDRARLGSRRLSSSQKIQDECHDQAQKNARRERCVKTEVTPFDADVAWQASKPWQFAGQEHENARYGDQYSND